MRLMSETIEIDVGDNETRQLTVRMADVPSTWYERLFNFGL